MKTTILCVVLVLATVLLVGATVWEGVSDVSAPKDLPRAYSIATNSFPRNTVVDVTNLENGKMVRVIVIANLETAGLLATLSRNAADAIDLRHDSTCRIRMNQSSDNAPPRARGTPAPQYQLGPIDASGAVLASTPTEETNNATLASRTPATESAPVASKPAATESAPIASKPVVTESAPVASKPVVMESAPIASKQTVTESAPVVSKPAATESAPVASKPAVTESAPVASKPVVMESAPVASKPVATESAPIASKPAATESAPVASKPVATESEPVESKPTVTNVLPAASIAIAGEPEKIADDVTAADEPALADDVIIAEKPAMSVNVTIANEPTTRDNKIVANKPAAQKDDVIAASEPTRTAEDIIVAGSPVAAGVPATAGTKSQPEPRISSGTLTMIPADERAPTVLGQTATASRNVPPRNAAPSSVAPNVTPAPSRTQPIEAPIRTYPPAEFSPFQAPLISSLERGKWYVQLGVYSRPDNVEDEISRIGTAYPVAIQNVGSDTSPMFRVLLGPLNQGESGAMLQRFKSIGYADAFVRHN